MSTKEGLNTPRCLDDILARTERAIGDYIDAASSRGTTKVSVMGYETPFPHIIPAELRQVDMPGRDTPNKVVSADLSFTYDGSEGYCTPMNAHLRLDNGYTVQTRRQTTIPCQANLPGEEMYDLTLRNPLGNSTGKRYPLPKSSLTDLLNDVGIVLPGIGRSSEQMPLSDMLQFTTSWTTETRHSTPLSSTQSMKIFKKEASEGIRDIKRFSFAPSTGNQAIVIKLDTAEAIDKLPNTSWQLYLTGRDELEPPEIQRMEFVPIAYTRPKQLHVEGLGSDEQPPIRNELIHKARQLRPSNTVFLAIQECMETARNGLSSKSSIDVLG